MVAALIVRVRVSKRKANYVSFATRVDGEYTGIIEDIPGLVGWNSLVAAGSIE